jgi:hypothetical protein
MADKRRQYSNSIPQYQMGINASCRSFIQQWVHLVMSLSEAWQSIQLYWPRILVVWRFYCRAFSNYLLALKATPFEFNANAHETPPQQQMSQNSHAKAIVLKIIMSYHECLMGEEPQGRHCMWAWNRDMIFFLI